MSAHREILLSVLVSPAADTAGPASAGAPSPFNQLMLRTAYRANVAVLPDRRIRQYNCECRGLSVSEWPRVLLAAPAEAQRLSAGLDGALCAKSDPDIFFPDDPSERERETAINLARAVCRRCNVQSTCLDLALVLNADSGVWAGTLPSERRLLQARARAAAATPFEVAKPG
jgi:WhiB family redox-sensing transcriptional regulator